MYAHVYVTLHANVRNRTLVHVHDNAEYITITPTVFNNTLFRSLPIFEAFLEIAFDRHASLEPVQQYSLWESQE